MYLISKDCHLIEILVIDIINMEEMMEQLLAAIKAGLRQQFFNGYYLFLLYELVLLLNLCH
jgi:hypothetical protein